MIEKAGALTANSAALAYTTDHSRSRALFERALHVMPGGNTRHSVALSPYPVYLSGGSGCRVTDVEGETRIDFLNNFTSIILGHADPDVTRIAVERIARGTAFAGPTETDVELAELLVERVPGVESLRFCNSGSEAVMLAVKAARAFTGRPKLAKFEGAYHGIYDHAQVSETSTPENWGPPERPASTGDAGTAPEACANVVVLPWNDTQACERLIEENGSQLCGVLIDPMPLGLSMIPARPGFFEAVFAAARRQGALVIADEVLNFRLGYHGAFAPFGLTADLVCLAKIIGGGFPVGALGGRAEVMDVFDHRRKDYVHHGGTFNANPVTMAAGLVTMRKMTPQAFAALDALGDSLRDQLRRMLKSRGVAGQVMGRGSLFAVRLTNETLSNWRDVNTHSRREPIYGKICHEMLSRGILMSQRGIVGSLSLAMGTSEIGAFVDALDSSLAALGRTA